MRSGSFIRCRLFSFSLTRRAACLMRRGSKLMHRLVKWSDGRIWSATTRSVTNRQGTPLRKVFCIMLLCRVQAAHPYPWSAAPSTLSNIRRRTSTRRAVSATLATTAAQLLPTFTSCCVSCRRVLCVVIIYCWVLLHVP